MEKEKVLIDFARNYEELFNSNLLSDIDIRIGDETVQAHKIVLVSQSPVFKRCFTSSPEEKSLSIENTDAKVFKTFLRFLYTCELNPEDISVGLLSLAHTYEHTNLKTICADHLIKTITEETAVDLLNLAMSIDNNDLKMAASNFIAKNIKSLIQKESFKEIYENKNAMALVMESFATSTTLKNDVYLKVYNNKVFQENLAPMYNSEDLSDVDIHVGDEIIKAHKFVLSTQSPVFRNTFANQGTKRKLNSDHSAIYVTEHSSKDFKNFLKFLYTSKIEVEEITNELMAIADEYQNENLKRFCVSKLVDTIDVMNATELLNLAIECKSVELTEKAANYIVDNLASIKRAGTYDLIHTHQKAVDSILDQFTTKVAKSCIKRKCQTFTFKNISNLTQTGNIPFIVENVLMEMQVMKIKRNGKAFFGFGIRNPCNNDDVQCEIRMNLRIELLRREGSTVIYQSKNSFRSQKDKFIGYTEVFTWECIMSPSVGYYNVKDDSITLLVHVNGIELKETDAPSDLRYTVMCH